MANNVGTLDRSLRIVGGLALLGLPLGVYGPGYTDIWGWVGIIPLVTGLVGQCGLYRALGIQTCPRA